MSAPVDVVSHGVTKAGGMFSLASQDDAYIHSLSIFRGNLQE